MGDLLVLSEDQVQQVLGFDELAGSVTEALISLSEGTSSVPSRVAAVSPYGLLGAMPGYVPGLGLASKLVSVYPDNPERGAPAHQGVIAVFDESGGEPLAVMGAAHITAIRTAMTSAIVARALARPDSRSLAVLGAGVQAGAHLTAVTRLVELDDVRITSRNTSRACLVAAEHPGAVVVSSARDAVEGADIVLCCTDARHPSRPTPG